MFLCLIFNPISDLAVTTVEDLFLTNISELDLFGAAEVQELFSILERETKLFKN